MAQDTIDKIIRVRLDAGELISQLQRVDAEIKKVNSANESLQKQYDESKISLDALTEGQIRNKNTLALLKNEQRVISRELQNTAKEAIYAEGSIDGLRASIGKLTREYHAMSAAERTSAKGIDLQKKIASLQEEVNEAQFAIRNYRDNVGNYASGFGALGFQVQQVARELPSLTNSFSQFFLAISNNLPMLADELQRASKANAALKKQGMATVPVFKQLLASILSWQTALVVGITLISAYSDEITSFIKSLFGAKEGALSAADAMDKVNQKMKDGANDSASQQIIQLEKLRREWVMLGDNLIEQKKFISENGDAFNQLGINISNVSDAENLFMRNTETFRKSIIERAKATAAMQLATERYKEYLDLLNDPSKKSIGEVLFGKLFSGESREDKMKRLLSDSNTLLELGLNLENTADTMLDSAGIATQGITQWAKTIDKIDNLPSFADIFGAKTSATTSILPEVEDAKSVLDDYGDIIEERAKELRLRLLRAIVSGGVDGANAEARLMLQEQLDNMESQLALLKSFSAEEQQKYADYEMMVLETMLKIRDIKAEILGLDKKEEEEFTQSSNDRLTEFLGKTAETTSAFSAMFDALGGEGEKFAAFSKSLAIFQVMLTQAEAIANAVNAGAEGAPWYMLPLTIGTAIATVTGAIANALNGVKSTSIPKYSTGGLVQGAGTATSDSIPAMLSNGESVMTARATAEWGDLLSAINVSSGGHAINVSNLPERADGMRGMRNMIKQILEEMPAPIVLVKDINRGQKQVKVAEQLSRLGGRKK